jgi:arylsulfatase A-like enzyme
MEDYLGCIASVDESVGRVLDYLDRSGLAESTLVVYTSDQGFYLGEHGWFDKRFMYEESLRMPLLVRLPGAVPPGSVNEDLVLNLDFGPTFLELAGVDIPSDMQGRSLRALLQAGHPSDWRQSFYYHYYEYPGAHMVKRHFGVRTGRYKLIRFYHDVDAWELYDLDQDPMELNNVYGDPAYSSVATELTQELDRLRRRYGDSGELDREFLRQDRERRDRR